MNDASTFELKVSCFATPTTTPTTSSVFSSSVFNIFPAFPYPANPFPENPEVVLSSEVGFLDFCVSPVFSMV